MNTTKLVQCDCRHLQQDQMHGPGMRVTTPVNREQEKKPPNMVVRCTVCRKEHRIS